MKKFLPKTSTNTQGFTLVELLVVIAIIAILATIGMVVFSGVQRNARDARRQSDVIGMSKAFEVNKVQGTTAYPVIAPTWFAGATIPSDTYVSPNLTVYSIIYSTAAGCTAITKPIAWSAGGANPTANGGTGTCTPITSAKVDTAPVGMTAFQICALLEGGTAPNIFCVPNAQ